jgi:hypothetical protein
MSQGNQKVIFKYTIDRLGDVIIASADLTKDGQSDEKTFAVNYQYDDDIQ